MSSKLDESEEYDDDFEEVSDDEGPHSASPAPALAQATPSTAAAAASSGGSGPTFTSQSSGGHAEAQEWEDVAFGDVTLGKKLGGGGFAIVYEGQWKGRKVALKTLVRRSTALGQTGTAPGTPRNANLCAVRPLCGRCPED